MADTTFDKNASSASIATDPAPTTPPDAPKAPVGPSGAPLAYGAKPGALDPSIKGPSKDSGKRTAPGAVPIGKPAKGKGKPGRPKGARDSPDTPRQVEARANAIRQENAERDRELLKRAETDPALRPWVDLPPEAMAPIYDLASATIKMSTGLPGLSRESAVKDEWCKAAAACANYYKLDLFSHPLVVLGVVSFTAATPSIAAWRVLKRIEALLKSGTPKDSPEVRALVQEAARLGVEVTPTPTPKDAAA